MVTANVDAWSMIFHAHGVDIDIDGKGRRGATIQILLCSGDASQPVNVQGGPHDGSIQSNAPPTPTDVG